MNIDQDDRDNLIALISRMHDDTLDTWLETLNEDELQYALNLLQTMICTRQAFVDSL